MNLQPAAPRLPRTLEVRLRRQRERQRQRETERQREKQRESLRGRAAEELTAGTPVFVPSACLPPSSPLPVFNPVVPSACLHPRRPLCLSSSPLSPPPVFIPVVPSACLPSVRRRLRCVQERDSQRRLIVVLQKATLETTKVGKAGSYELLNCDDHQNILRKNNRDIADCRPDITHQVQRCAG